MMLPTNEDEYNEMMDDFIGDPRYCPRHPGEKTSSDNGLFDGPCNICEGEMSEEAARWDYDPANTQRKHCGNEVYIPQPYFTMTCVSILDDNIPF
jgi:hypothetical protein